MKHSLFRSIRHKLLNEGKLLRYLSYAVGEVVLIIVGILMALKINDWNEDKKAQAEFDAYIVQLREDVKKAHANALRAVESCDRWMKSSFEIVDFVKQEQTVPISLEDFERKLGSLGRYSLPDIQIGLLARLLNGDYDRINRDDTLSEHALHMESEIENALRIIAHNRELHDQSSQILMKYRTLKVPGVPDRKIMYDLQAMRTSTEFIFAAEMAAHSHAAIKMYSDIAAESLESFLNVLEEYD